MFDACFYPQQLTQDSIFSIIDWTIRLRDFDEGIYFPDNCCYKIA